VRVRATGWSEVLAHVARAASSELEQKATGRSLCVRSALVLPNSRTRARSRLMAPLWRPRVGLAMDIARLAESDFQRHALAVFGQRFTLAP
jgi:hypothetical protein